MSCLPKHGWRLLVMVLPALIGCGSAVSPTVAADAGSEEVALPLKDFAAIARGEKLYGDYCANCHGAEAEGHPEWRQKRADGKFNAPPLNGSGHTWHHPMALLRKQIGEGSNPRFGSMPGFGEALNDRQIDDIIAWFQSLWSEEVYQAWYKTELRAQALKQ